MMNQKAVFFGCSLDCDEREEAIQEKRIFQGHQDLVVDPYEGVMAILRKELPPDQWLEKGSLEVPSRLGPLPSFSDNVQLTIEAFVRFVDSDGCRDYARQVGDFVAEKIHPHLPCLIAVDHSLTGGVYRKLKALHDPEEISLIVLDSHTDALTVPLLAQAIQYDLDTNPDSLHDSHDPFLYNRPDSYNASSFLDHLLAEKVLQPEHLYILGIGDYPPKQAFRIKDQRIQNYVGRFQKLKEQGVTLLTKNDLLVGTGKLKSILKQIRTPWVYLSIDMDIGARNALEGVRYGDRQGLNGPQLMRLVGTVREVLQRGVRLAGMDLCEFNPRKAFQDPTYRIAADLVKILLGF
ncbi:MAG: arginase family protein [Pseudomonadota bacterium]